MEVARNLWPNCSSLMSSLWVERMSPVDAHRGALLVREFGPLVEHQRAVLSPCR